MTKFAGGLYQFAFYQGNQDGSADALKVAHSKPQPTVEKPHPQAKAKQINQPRK